MDEIVAALVPSMTTSLAARFNLFRVMHHGTHEKQLSNIFAWLLDAEGTHGLGEAFQELFVSQINHQLPDDKHLHTTGYTVAQEVDTSGVGDRVRDIADIVLSDSKASIVIENFESSDGHGHNYFRYLAHGALGDRRSVVVLLCVRREPYRLTDGWEKAILITYSDVLELLAQLVKGEPAWSTTHPEQLFFLSQLIDNFTESPRAMSHVEQVAFVSMMCQTGESRRFGQRPQERAAQEFADEVARHARQRFADGRQALGSLKRALKSYAQHTLSAQLNLALPEGPIVEVSTGFVGRWEWCVMLGRGAEYPDLFIEFGPTAVVENDRVRDPLGSPDYSKVFITRRAATVAEGIDLIAQTDVGLEEVLGGLSSDDYRLRDALVALAAAPR